MGNQGSMGGVSGIIIGTNKPKLREHLKNNGKGDKVTDTETVAYDDKNVDEDDNDEEDDREEVGEEDSRSRFAAKSLLAVRWLHSRQRLSTVSTVLGAVSRCP